MSSSLEELITISPPIWPGKKLAAQPGDLSILAPMGIGIEGPFPVRPWDNPLAGSPAGYYSYQIPSSHPFLNAPTSEAASGTVYFDGQPEKEDVAALLRLLEVGTREKCYAAFLGHSEDPEEEGYLTQLRLATRFALKYMFHALTSEEYDAYPEQNLDIGEVIWKFIENQQERWGTGMSPALCGAMGGDGDWAREALAFGFMVENSYHGVYRIWSRAWLVTK